MMEHVRKIWTGRYLRKVIIYLLMFCLALNTSLPVVSGTPTGAVVDIGPGGGGEANITYNTGAFENTTQVDVLSNETIIDWTSLDTAGGPIDARETLLFTQGGFTDSAVLNRVSGAATQFNGDLIADGMRIFIVNPAGVIFGEGSTVNVTQLVASGLGMSNDAFHAILDNATNPMAFEGGDGEVQNSGQIQADSVYLVGKKVYNFGSIVAPEGLVVMAAGDSVFLGQDGGNVLVEVEADPMDPSADVTNAGSISAYNGIIVLAAGDTFSRAIANVGTLTASAGSITAYAARIENAGTINADAVGSDEGSISLTVSEGIVLKGAGTTTANGGTMLIDAPELTIADGYIPAEPPDNTLYEKWVEERSQAGTDLELVASSSTYGNIFVENVSDGEITGGSGDIALHTTYDTGGITFLPPTGGGPVTTAIHTTNGGSVYMLAGKGGITVGDISTDVPSYDKITEPGKIRLFTNNYGIIQTGALTVNGGSYDEVSVIASGDLIINGDVETITNQVPSDVKEIGQARTCLVSVYGDVDINGAVTVKAHGKDYSTADIHICAGENVTVTLGPDQKIDASAHTSEIGPADASVLIHAGKNIDGPGVISFNGGGNNPVHVYAKAGGGTGTAEVYSSDNPADWDETDGNAHAVLDIDEDRTADCPDCPMPPGLTPPIPPVALPDEATTHMGDPISGNVLGNDTPPEGGEFTAVLVSEPENGELVEFDWDTGDYTYEPDDGYVGTDTFTYIATDGEIYTEPITVTITVNNTLPDTVNDAVTIETGDAVVINVLANDSDLDSDPLTVDSFTYEGTGTLVLNEDGTFAYTPGEGFAGEDSFTYDTTDGQLDGEEPVVVTATVTITVIPEEPPPPALPYMAAAPGLERIEIEISGCPALMTWVAQELGVDKRMVQIWMVNTMASIRDIQPCDTCASLRRAATILQDAEGIHTAALAQVINEFASSTAPPSGEQMALIANAIASNIEGDNHYARAGKYLDALTEYVGILNIEMNFSAEESIAFAADNHISRLSESADVGVAAYIAARLAALGG
jgi:filamentous hemagglutinin family protein